MCVETRKHFFINPTMNVHKRKDRHAAQEKSAKEINIDMENSRPKKKGKKETTVARQGLKIEL